MDKVSQALKVAQLKSKVKKGSLGNVGADKKYSEPYIDSESYVFEAGIPDRATDPRLYKAGIPETTSDPRLYKAGINTETKYINKPMIRDTKYLASPMIETESTYEDQDGSITDNELEMLKGAQGNMIKKTRTLEEDKKKLKTLTPVLDYLNKR